VQQFFLLGCKKDLAWHARARVHMHEGGGGVCACNMTCQWLITEHDSRVCVATHSCVCVLQLTLCVAVCCGVLQCVAVQWGVLQCIAVQCSVLQCVVMRCSALQCIAVRCSELQGVVVRCSVNATHVRVAIFGIWIIIMPREGEGGEARNTAIIIQIRRFGLHL